jgi:hypothetical protein
VDKQIGQRYQEPSVTTLEERIRALEDQVRTLSDVTRILARGLEDLPTAEPGQRPAADAARRAHELLLVADRHGSQAG